MTHNDDKMRLDPHGLEDWKPKRHQPAHARILYPEEGGVREVPFQNAN
jgi:hypothetical protein